LAAAQDNHAWKTYANERFGFSVRYPSDLLQPEAAPDNNDGRTFIGSNDAKIAAWASWNAMGGTLADSARQDEKRLANDAGKVTYKVIRKGFYVISGPNGDQIFYNRTALANGKVSAVELTYPTADSTARSQVRSHRCTREGRYQDCGGRAFHGVCCPSRAGAPTAGGSARKRPRPFVEKKKFNRTA
jgi:hypothetical protein